MSTVRYARGFRVLDALGQLLYSVWERTSGYLTGWLMLHSGVFGRALSFMVYATRMALRTTVYTLHTVESVAGVLAQAAEYGAGAE